MSNDITIHEYAASGNIAGFMELCERNVSLLDQRSAILSQTPLHVAIGHNQVDMAVHLLALIGRGDKELEAVNIYGETPLHLAAKNGCNEAAEKLLDYGAYIEARTSNGMTPLHLAAVYAIQSGDKSMVNLLIKHYADCSALDKEGKTPLNYLLDKSENEELCKLLLQCEKGSSNYNLTMKRKIDEFNYELSKIICPELLKRQLRKWAQLVMSDMHPEQGEKPRQRNKLHMEFSGNPGSGKITVARILGKLLFSVGILSSGKVIEVKQTDLVVESVSQTKSITRKKIQEANGGILFVTDDFRLVSHKSCYFSEVAFKEIMSIAGDRNLVIIFDTDVSLSHVYSSYGIRVTKFFHFDNYTSTNIAEMLVRKMNKQQNGSPLFGFKLHSDCTVNAVAELISNYNIALNEKLVDHMLYYARENLDSRLACDPTAKLLLITFTDLEMGLSQLLRKSKNQYK